MTNFDIEFHDEVANEWRAPCGFTTISQPINPAPSRNRQNFMWQVKDATRRAAEGHEPLSSYARAGAAIGGALGWILKGALFGAGFIIAQALFA